MDCEWSPYGNWSECSKSCGGGIKLSTRTIIQFAQYGGKSCDGESSKNETCNEQICPGIIYVISIIL